MRGRRRRRPSRALQEDGSSDQLTVESWPPWLLSDSFSSPFVLEGVGVIEGVPACEGVRPAVFVNGTRLSPVILHRNWTYAEVVQGSRGELPMRSVLWYGRSGLGNTLRGLVNAVIFALLSSRQLLMSTGGQYGESIRAMLEGFTVALDMTDQALPRVPMYDYSHAVLADGRPVLQGNPNVFCDSLWFPDLERRECVYAALDCSSVGCVRSRIVNLALGPPKIKVGVAIESMLVVELPSPSQLQAVPPAATLGPATLSIPPQVQQPRRLRSTTPQLYDKSKSGHVGLQRKLQEQPGSKGLRVKFDVAVHVRTVHKCLEKNLDLPGCRDQGLQHSKKALSTFPELSDFVSVHCWSCISHLLGFLLAQKKRRIQETQGAYKGLFRDPADKTELSQYLERAAQSPGKRPLRTVADAANQIDGKKQPGEVWLPEDARAVAEEAQKEAGQGSWEGRTGLNIFLATDSAALRPLLVEYLKPFGTVAHSHVRPVHVLSGKLSKWNSLGVFYLMSRASVVVEYQSRTSSFSTMAANYGNTSLIRAPGRIESKERCHFVPLRIADPPQQ